MIGCKLRICLLLETKIGKTRFQYFRKRDSYALRAFIKESDVAKFNIIQIP